MAQENVAVERLQTYLDSLGDKLSTQEKVQIMGLAKDIGTVATSQGIMGALMVGS